MTIKVNCENRNSKRKVDLVKIEKIAREIFRQLKRDNVELNIVFFSNQKIRAINRRFLRRDSATDVIAFPSGEDTGRRKKGSGLFLGDIAISSDKAARNAGEYGTSFMEETALYVIHGILHLVGYDHRMKKDSTIMRRKENGIFQKIKKTL